MLDNPKNITAETLKVQYDKVFNTPLPTENADNQDVKNTYEAEWENLLCDVTFSKDEIVWAINKLLTNSAPGSDNIPVIFL